MAKLAGIPAAVVERAKGHLEELEAEREPNKGIEKAPLAFDFSFQAQVDGRYEKVKTILETYDLNNITPLQALQLLDKIKDALK